jgi:hypothetical protein
LFPLSKLDRFCRPRFAKCDESGINGADASGPHGLRRRAAIETGHSLGFPPECPLFCHSFAEFDASVQGWINHVRYADS